MKFLKEFGIGIIFAICSPLLLVLIALVAVFGILDFIVEFVIMMVNFFSGKKCFPVFEEDEEAYKRKQEALNLAQAKEQPQPAPQPNNIYVQQVYYNTTPGAMGPMGQQGIPFQNPQGMQQPGVPFQNPQGIQQQGNPFQANQIPQPNPSFMPFTADRIPGEAGSFSEASFAGQIPMQQQKEPVEAPVEQAEEAKHE